MDPRLTLETMATLAGVVVFIELMLELFVKRALRTAQNHPDYGLFLNVAALVSGFIGSVAAQWARGDAVSGPAMVAIMLRCVEATAFAIGGFEFAKHLRRRE